MIPAPRISPAALILALAVLGCGERSADATRVAFITNGSADFWAIARSGVQEAERSTGVTCDFHVPAEANAEAQQRLIETVIARGARALAISPLDSDNQVPMLDEAAKALQLVCVDSDAPRSKRLAYVGTDNVGAGRAAGNLLKEILPSGGRIMLFVGRMDAQNAKERTQGIREAIAGSGVEIVDIRTDLGDPAKAKANVQDTLAAHPDIAGLVGLWSYDGPAILTAVEEAGRAGRVAIVTFDEEDAVLAGIERGVIAGTIVQDPWRFGHDAVVLMAKLARGEPTGAPPSGIIDVPVRTIRRADVAAFRADLRAKLGR
ncbi:MAG: sugar-binding protein [Planctomycetes bacterium]|nr:sugar-binding protein [Planctomycetota bacterium]MCC7170985.1 sugar-binding protein [Planctomycetota bacterium]